MLKKYNDEENLIYNRFDLIYPENYKECIYRYSYEIFILHYHLEGDFAMIDVWARDIPQAVFERFVEDIFENNPDVFYIRVDGSLNNYHERLQMIRNVYIELPDRNNRIDDRLSLKTLRSIQRKERRLAEKYGDISTKVYKDQIPIEVVNKYFEWKRISHRAEYHLTAVEYIKRYHVTHALELLGDNRSIAVVFCCIVSKTAYLENLSYDNDASKYSAGLIAYKYMLEYLSDIGIRRFYLGREGQDYKNHFGSIKQDAFWGNIISERAIERVKKQLIHIDCRKVAIYGLGNVGREFLRYSDYLDAKVIFAIDRNIKSCDQLTVYGPDEIFPLCDLVIITMEKKNKEVEANLERRGLKYLYWRELLKGGDRMNSRKMTYLADLYSYIKNIGDKAVLSNKQIIIWGYSKGGAFVRRLLEEYDQRIRIAYIIDDCMQIPADFSPKLYRSTILEYIDGSRYILLSTIKDYLKVEKYAGEFGFISEQNMFDVRSRIGVSYIDFLQIKNDRLDFAYVTVKERPDIYSQPNVAISTPFEGVYVDKLFNDISILEEKISFLDYGCGKGQILFYAHVWGLDNVKGIEFVPEIADQANLNMKELNIPAHVICNDARAVTDIDDVNVFFFNNPFLGDIFETVIDNIEKSAIRNPRRIHIVYLNPRCHRIVIKNGIFKLDRQLYIDAGDPLANFYINEA